MSGEGLIAEPRAVHSSVGHARLKELMHRGTEFLGCEVAILGGAMSWVSERNLVSALSNAGAGGEQVWNLITSGAFISVLPLLLSFLLLQRYWQGGLTLGSVK